MCSIAPYYSVGTLLGPLCSVLLTAMTGGSHLVKGVARLEYDGWEEQEEKGFWREALVEGEVLVG